MGNGHSPSAVLAPSQRSCRGVALRYADPANDRCETIAKKERTINLLDILVVLFPGWRHWPSSPAPVSLQVAAQLSPELSDGLFVAYEQENSDFSAVNVLRCARLKPRGVPFISRCRAHVQLRLASSSARSPHCSVFVKRQPILQKWEVGFPKSHQK